MYFKFCKGKLGQILSCLAATFGLFPLGITYMWPAPIILKLLQNTTNHGIPFHITTSEASWIASMEMLILPGAALLTIILVNYFGAKNVIILAGIPLIVSWIVVVFAENITDFYLARFLVAFSHAFLYGSTPIYASEVAEPQIRGVLNYFTPILFNLGGVIVFYFGYVLPVNFFPLVTIIPSIFQVIFGMGVPQTPYFLITRNKYDAAKATLKQLRGDSYTDQEFETIKSFVQTQMAVRIKVWELVGNRVIRKSFGIIVMMTTIQQMSGTSSVTNYLHYIVEESGTQLSVELVATVSGVIMLISSVCAVFFIDQQGRRPLVIFSILGVVGTMLLEGIYFYLKECDYGVEKYSMISTISLLLYIFFINFGINYISPLLSSEIFPTNLKFIGVSVVTITYGVFGFISNKIFQIISDQIGLSVVFFTHAAFALVGFVLIFLYLPETRHKTLEEIQIMLNN